MRPLLEREFSPIFIFEDLDEAYKEGHGPLRGAILFERGATSPEEGAYLHRVPPPTQILLSSPYFPITGLS